MNQHHTFKSTTLSPLLEGDGTFTSYFCQGARLNKGLYSAGQINRYYLWDQEGCIHFLDKLVVFKQKLFFVTLPVLLSKILKKTESKF